MSLREDVGNAVVLDTSPAAYDGVVVRTVSEANPRPKVVTIGLEEFVNDFDP